jgi:hypothetical protein
MHTQFVDSESFLSIADVHGTYDFNRRVTINLPVFHQDRKAFWFKPINREYMNKIRSAPEVSSQYDTDCELFAFWYSVHVPVHTQLLVTWFCQPKNPIAQIEFCSGGPVVFQRTREGRLLDRHERSTATVLPNNLWITDAEYDTTACAVWFTDANAIAACNLYTQAFACDPTLKNSVGLIDSVIRCGDTSSGVGVELLRISRNELSSVSPSIYGR